MRCHHNAITTRIGTTARGPARWMRQHMPTTTVLSQPIHYQSQRSQLSSPIRDTLTDQTSSQVSGHMASALTLRSCRPVNAPQHLPVRSAHQSEHPTCPASWVVPHAGTSPSLPPALLARGPPPPAVTSDAGVNLSVRLRAPVLAARGLVSSGGMSPPRSPPHPRECRPA